MSVYIKTEQKIHCLNCYDSVILSSICKPLDTGSRQYEPEGKKGNTDPLSAFYSHGLPHDAYPAAYNGSDIPYAQLSP